MQVLYHMPGWPTLAEQVQTSYHATVLKPACKQFDELCTKALYMYTNMYVDCLTPGEGRKAASTAQAVRQWGRCMILPDSTMQNVIPTCWTSPHGWKIRCLTFLNFTFAKWLHPYAIHCSLPSLSYSPCSFLKCNERRHTATCAPSWEAQIGRITTGSWLRSSTNSGTQIFSRASWSTGIVIYGEVCYCCCSAFFYFIFFLFFFISALCPFFSMSFLCNTLEE